MLQDKMPFAAGFGRSHRMSVVPDWGGLTFKFSQDWIP